LQILQDCLQAPAGRQAAEGPSAAASDNVYRLLVATGQKIAGDFALTQVTPRDMNCQGQVSHHWWLLYCCCCTAAAVLLLLYCCCCTAAACQLPGHWVMMGSSPAGAVPCAAGLLFFCISCSWPASQAEEERRTDPGHSSLPICCCCCLCCLHGRGTWMWLMTATTKHSRQQLLQAMLQGVTVVLLHWSALVAGCSRSFVLT
jgi:hypothetical protein